MCVSFVCVTFITQTNGRGYTSDRWQGRQRARVPPSPSQGRATVRLPPSKFFYFSEQIFYFFLPYPIKAPIYPFSFPLRGFLFLCVYFPIRVSFRVSEGENGVIGIVFPPVLPVFVWLLCALFSFYIFCYFPLLCFPPVILSCISPLFLPLCYVLVLSFVVDAVFFVDLPILLPSVGLSLLLCVIIRLGVFRGSEAKKQVFVSPDRLLRGLCVFRLCV